MAGIPPNQTVYVNNLNEKLKKEELKKALYHVFSQFGPIAEIVALKTVKMRGQAFIVFEDLASATKAVRDMPGFLFYNKPMKVGYAKSKSDVIAKRDGTYKARKRVKTEDNDTDTKMTPAPPLSAPPPPQSRPPPQNTEPHTILFVQNLPKDATDRMLSTLFAQYPGFKEAKLIPGKPGIAFVYFESESQSAEAKDGLQDFNVDAQHTINVSYAKKDE